MAGGGGAANTGVKNGFEIFEIINNGEQIVGESITRLDRFLSTVLVKNFSFFPSDTRLGATMFTVYQSELEPVTTICHTVSCLQLATMNFVNFTN